ncbi:MAG: thiamine diphosphokinase [Clostridia bacterium]|nr:thiamine diphosphokinase [Clostridia bacterium]
MNTLIISGGNVDIEFLNKTLTNFSYDNIIAVDKGLETLYLLKIMPTHIVGDFDSVNKNIINYYNDKNIPVHKYNPEKDYTDTDIAMKLAINLNSTNITIIGATRNKIRPYSCKYTYFMWLLRKRASL